MEASEATAVQGYDPSQLRELLQVYYTWLFPYDRYFQWLQYGTNVDECLGGRGEYHDVLMLCVCAEAQFVTETNSMSTSPLAQATLVRSRTESSPSPFRGTSM